jgi:hypothetical protein
MRGVLGEKNIWLTISTVGPQAALNKLALHILVIIIQAKLLLFLWERLKKPQIGLHIFQKKTLLSIT